MNDDDTSAYLWDGTGTPDPEVAHLEDLLRPYRHAGEVPPLVLPRPRPRALRLFAAAAAIATIIGIGALVSQLGQTASFNVVTTGAAWVAGNAVEGATRLRVGEHLTTGEGGATVQLPEIGELTLAANTDLLLVKTSSDLHLLSLQQGRVEAVVDAPPRLLVVQTPSLTAVDLGCIYTLDVTPAGVGRLEVESGWVELEGGPSRTFVVEGMAADFNRTGPSIPVRTDASAAFSSTVAALNVDGILAHAVAADDVTLWHVFSRVSPSDQARVLDRLSSRTPIAAAAKKRMLSGDQAALHVLLDRIAMRPITGGESSSSHSTGAG